MVYNKLINFSLSRNFLFNSSIKVEKFLSDDEVSKIENEILKNITLETAVIGNGQKKDAKRKSEVNFVHYTLENSWLFQKINYTVEKINEEYYNFDLNGYDYLQYSEYDSKISGHYGQHIDFMTDIIPSTEYDFMTRKLSFSLLLNDDYEGGEFFINLGEKSNINLRRGDLIVFPSFVMHGVNTVKSGVRKSLVGWVNGPKFK